jgi:prophage antirepressor-like protein
MTDEIQTTQTNPTGPKRGGRKAASPAPDGGLAAGIPQRDQSPTAEEVLQESAQTIVPVPFDFQGKAVRTITKNGEVWFVAADVCAVLEHSNPTKAVERLDDDERGLTTIQAPSGNDQIMNVVTESGLYSLVFTSRKSEAKGFRRWVTGVVLPTLRQTGRFDVRGEPSQGMAGQRQAENGDSNGITVTLPGPGRYLVGLFLDGELRIEPLCFSDAISALAALDCRSIAYSHLTAASLWEKLQHLRTSKTDVSAGYTQGKLNATMQAGAELARQILYTYDEPGLVPRSPAKVPAE